MDIPADAVLVPAHDQENLAVRLQACQAVDDMAPGFFQLLCPEDIVFLIKTGLQFHQNRDLLPIFSSADQGGDNRGMPAHTV